MIDVRFLAVARDLLPLHAARIDVQTDTSDTTSADVRFFVITVAAKHLFHLIDVPSVMIDAQFLVTDTTAVDIQFLVTIVAARDLHRREAL